MFFASTDGLRLPHIQTYIAENLFIILIFYSPFFFLGVFLQPLFMGKIDKKEKSLKAKKILIIVKEK